MPLTEDSQPLRVVVLGGGPAGVAAAYWLSRPEQKGRYQVTLYSQGWRLGGKCASGRNADQGERIEEHGLHMLMGCYQNAFATLRACYADWRTLKPDPSSPFQTWTDAFLPQRLVSLMQEVPQGPLSTWEPWNFNLPKLPGEPGDGPLAPGSGDSPAPPSVAGMVQRLMQWLEDGTPASVPYRQALVGALSKVRAVFLANTADTAEAQSALADAASAIRRASGVAPEDAADFDPLWLQRLALLAKIGVAVCFGFLRDIWNKGPNAWNLLDETDFRAWLASCGADSETVSSPPIDAFYDLTFANLGGPPGGTQGGSLAAGVSLLAQMEMFLGYRNAPLFKMAAGMGDTVFTPFWDVLTARGVDIRLFSRVVSLTASDDHGQLAQIVIQTQAKTSGEPYRPFRRVKNLDCWPDQPDWCQLANGDWMRQQGFDFEFSGCDYFVASTTLDAGQDFDIAIVALPPQALQRFASGLEQTSAWSAAIGASASVGTHSLQLWMSQSVADLGWTAGATVLSSFEEPYDSWGDMSQVLAMEDWPGPTQPQSIGYFCGCMAPWMGLPPYDPGELDKVAEAAADAWMTPNLATLWPNIGPNPTQAPFSRYDVANFDVSDTYVQTPAGNNVASRLDPSQASPFTNLYAVGDWTRTRFSGGCFESAIESAMLASRAISGFPQDIKTG